MMEVVQTIASVVGVIAGCLALWTYWRNFQLKKAEWLEKLHAKFFESQSYKRIRRILDYQSAPDFEELRRAVSGENGQDELSEALVDYLNFFEYIACLAKLKQLDTKDILMLFDYYLRLLNKNDFVLDFIKAHGFEHLQKLLEKVSGDKGGAHASTH